MSEPSRASSSPSRAEQELFQVIDQEASSSEESRDSKEIYNALVKNRDKLSGDSHLPEDNSALTDSIRDAATKRSQELIGGSAGALGGAGLFGANERPVPVWLWLAWAVAIAGAIAGLFYFW